MGLEIFALSYSWMALPTKFHEICQSIQQLLVIRQTDGFFDKPALIFFKVGWKIHISEKFDFLYM